MSLSEIPAPADPGAGSSLGQRVGYPAEPRVLILGYGNPGRQDDGLGPEAARRIEALAKPNVTTIDNYQLNIEDAVDVADHDEVWFVDASRTGSAPFTIHRLAPATSFDFTSHLVRPEAILAMADQYYGGRPRAYLLAIRGYAFEFVEALTPSASDNLRQAVDMLTDQLRSLQPAPE